MYNNALNEIFKKENYTSKYEVIIPQIFLNFNSLYRITLCSEFLTYFYKFISFIGKNTHICDNSIIDVVNNKARMKKSIHVFFNKNLVKLSFASTFIVLFSAIFRNRTSI